MKKINSLLFVFIALVAFVFNSCGSDNEDDPTDPTIEETITVQNKLKNQFFKIGNVAFQFINDKEVHVWTDIVNNGESYKYIKSTYTVYQDKDYIGIKNISTIIHYLLISNNIQYYTDQEHNNEITSETKPNNYEEKDKKPIEDNWQNMKLNTLIIDGITYSDVKYKYDTESQISVHDSRHLYIYKKDANMDTWLVGGESSLELRFFYLGGISDLLKKDYLDVNLCSKNSIIKDVYLRNYLVKEDRLDITMSDDKYTKEVIKIVEQNNETKNVKLYIDIIGYIYDKQNDKDIDITIKGLIEVRAKMR